VKAAGWEKEHGYTKEHNCAFCKHSEAVEYIAFRYKIECREREKAGAGKNVRSNGCCNLWEHK
jgi:hypothetical protein